jgi:hypothetical protein
VLAAAAGAIGGCGAAGRGLDDPVGSYGGAALNFSLSGMYS